MIQCDKIRLLTQRLYRPSYERVLYIVVLVLVSLLMLVACSGNSPRSANSKSESASSELRLKIPVVPAMLSDSAKLEFMAEHYWDNFDYADTVWIADTAALERTFADWAQLLTRLPQQKAGLLLGSMISNAGSESDMFLRLSEVAELFFYNLNSPYNNEDIYISMLETIIESSTIDSLYKIRPRAQLASAMKNRPGMQAADFVYTKSDGTTARLYELSAQYTLLLFYVPDCPNCAAVERHIVSSSIFTPLLSAGKLKLLAVYPGKDYELWKEHLADMPDEWIVGRDEQRVIDSQELYDIRTTPALYLLDCNKKVILKDVLVNTVEEYINENVN